MIGETLEERQAIRDRYEAGRCFATLLLDSLDKAATLSYTWDSLEAGAANIFSNSDGPETPFVQAVWHKVSRRPLCLYTYYKSVPLEGVTL